MPEKRYGDRIAWIDVAKGIGIILVVIGHLFRNSMCQDYGEALFVKKWIYSFHMPLMMFFSGVMFNINIDRYKKGGFKSFFTKKFVHLLWVYIINATAVYAIISIFLKIPKIENILNAAGYMPMSIIQFVSGVLEGQNEYSFHLWYIYGYAFILLISYIFATVRKSTMKDYRIIWLIVAILLRIFSYTDYPVIRIISIIRQMSVWFAIGLFYDELERIVNKKLSWFMGICALLLLSVKEFWFTHMNLLIGEFVSDLLIILTILLFVEISKKLVNAKLINYLGKKSFVIYLFHQPFIAAGLGGVLYDVIGLHISICLVLTFICSIVLPIFIESLLHKLNMSKYIL